MECEYELKCEIRQCRICKDWIDYPATLVIIKQKHYHQRCVRLLYQIWSYPFQFR